MSSVSDQPGKQVTTNGRVHDLDIADAIAAAVLAVPAVARLCPGHSALAATYGPTRRVTGVVVRRLAPTEMSLEVHVALRVAATDLAASRKSPKVRKGASSAGEGGILPAMASRVRETVFRTFGEMSLPPPIEVDVFIDDIV